MKLPTTPEQVRKWWMKQMGIADENDPVNIVSGGIARKMLYRLKEFDNTIAREDVGPFTFTLRLCTVAHERSGGAVVTVSLYKRYDHTSCIRNREFTRKLSAGYSEKSVIAAVGRCFAEAKQEKQRRDMVEEFYKRSIRAENKLSIEAIAEIVAVGEAAGFKSSYDDMQQHDVDYWSKVFFPAPAKPSKPLTS